MNRPMLKLLISVVLCLVCAPCPFAQTLQDAGTSGVPSRNATLHGADTVDPYEQEVRRDNVGQDTRGVPCGPGGCITSNDKVSTQREAGAEGLVPGYSRTRAVARSGVPNATGDDVATDEPKSAFEDFVEDTTGHRLPIYGRSLFLNRPTDFVPASSVVPPPEYLLGAGDQVKVRAWGNVSIDVLSTVDRNGQVFVPQVGTVAVAGLHMQEAQSAIRTAIRKQYESFELSVTLGQLRSMQIMVLGEARRPGVYTVSSLSTLVNALFASGGPGVTGSLRDVQLKREGATVTHLDVYGLLLRGDKTGDISLRAGDIIWIPPVGPQAAVDGEVKRPAIFELRSDESAATLVEFADGLTPLANRDRATLDRIDSRGQRVMQEFAFTGAQNLIHLQGGDLLRLRPVSSQVQQAVTLTGNVANPGRYPFREGMRVSDLLPTRQALITRGYYNRQNTFDSRPLNRPFQESNSERKPVIAEAVKGEDATAAANGVQVNTPGSGSELVENQNDVNWRYATIQRLSRTDLTPELLSFDLGAAIDNPSSAENKPLQPGDTLVIYSGHDVNLPQELRADFVRLDGEVVHPGVYRVLPNETIRQLVMRAGGLGPHAYLYAAQLQRESVRIAQEVKLQSLLREETQRILSPTNRTTSQDGKTEGSDLELRRAYINALSQIHANGRVILRLPADSNAVADVPDLPLQNKDHFFVPARPSTVDVIGNVFNPGTQMFEEKSTVRTYLQAAGNNTREADKPREFLLRADGIVVSRTQTRRFENLQMRQGDTIVVPARLKPGFNLTEVLAYAQIVSTTALTAVAVRALQ